MQQLQLSVLKKEKLPSKLNNLLTSRYVTDDRRRTLVIRRKQNNVDARLPIRAP